MDITIVSGELEKYVKEIVIDKERKFTPFKQINGTTVSFPDHYAIMVNFEGIPMKARNKKTHRTHIDWNTNKPGGWEIYKNLTSKNKKFDEFARLETNDPDKLMNLIDKELKSIKFNAFGKVKIKKKTEYDELSALIEKRNALMRNKPSVASEEIENLEYLIAKSLQIKQKKNLDNELEKLTDLIENNGRPKAASYLKESILGNKKNTDEPCAIRNPKTNKLVFNSQEIIKVSADYCVDLLTNREPKEGFENDLKLKRLVHEVRMENKDDDDDEYKCLTKELYYKSFNILKKKKSEKYKFILNAGAAFHEALFNLY